MKTERLEALINQAIACRADLICQGQDPYKNYAIKVSKLNKDKSAYLNFCWFGLDLAEQDGVFADLSEEEFESAVIDRINQILHEKEEHEGYEAFGLTYENN